MRYIEITIAGVLELSWKEWLDGFSLSYTEERKTCITGEIEDQAQLFGLFGKLRDLGVEILKIQFGPKD